MLLFFSSLFSAHAQSLPHEERKAYAEKVSDVLFLVLLCMVYRHVLLLCITLQVVMSFWQAIGGDEEEVCVDSSSDSESTTHKT